MRWLYFDSIESYPRFSIPTLLPLVDKCEVFNIYRLKAAKPQKRLQNLLKINKIRQNVYLT